MLEEVRKAKFYAIMADGVESYHSEQLPLYLRFIDEKDNIWEKLLEFRRCRQINGEAVFTEITWILKKCEIDDKLCRGQGYDGASNMSSEVIGAEKRIKDISKKEVFDHCFGHNLSLVVLPAGKIPIIILGYYKRSFPLVCKGKYRALRPSFCFY